MVANVQIDPKTASENVFSRFFIKFREIMSRLATRNDKPGLTEDEIDEIREVRIFLKIQYDKLLTKFRWKSLNFDEK